MPSPHKNGLCRKHLREYKRVVREREEFYNSLPWYIQGGTPFGRDKTKLERKANRIMVPLVNMQRGRHGAMTYTLVDVPIRAEKEHW